MRAHVESARAAGVNLGFFGADAMYWHIRLGPSDLGPDRLITCYKSATLDPMARVNKSEVTTLWRDAPLNRPENAVIGEMYDGSIPGGSGAPGAPLVVTDASSWVYRGLDVANGTAIPNVVGYEYDRVFNNGYTPRGLQVLSQSPLVNSFGSHDVSNATIYTAASGATVFAAGSIYWADALDDQPTDGIAVLDSRVQGITANVLARLGQPPSVTPHWPVALPIAATRSNLIRNGSFETGKAPWQLVATRGRVAEGSWSVTTSTAVDEASADVHVDGHLPYGSPAVQLMQQFGPLTVVPGHVFTLRFWGRASTVRTVRVAVQSRMAGQRLAGPDLTLTPFRQNFEFTFQAIRDDATVNVLTFELDPTIQGEVWLNGVELVAGRPAVPRIG